MNENNVLQTMPKTLGCIEVHTDPARGVYVSVVQEQDPAHIARIIAFERSERRAQRRQELLNRVMDMLYNVIAVIGCITMTVVVIRMTM